MSFFQPTTQNATIEKEIFHRPITEHGLFTLYNIIENTDCSFIDNNCELDSEHLFETFLGTIAHNVNVCFPLIKIQPKHGKNILNNNWFNEKLRKMRDTLQLLNTLRNNKTVDNTTYQNFRNLCRKELTKAKKTFNEQFIHKAANKPKAMWEIIKKKLKKI
jgi:hypothetical protein